MGEQGLQDEEDGNDWSMAAKPINILDCIKKV